MKSAMAIGQQPVAITKERHGDLHALDVNREGNARHLLMHLKLERTRFVVTQNPIKAYLLRQVYA